MLEVIKKHEEKKEPLWALKQDISRVISNTLHKLGSSKNGKSAKSSFPWSDEELKERFELLFTHPDNLDSDGKPWMTWNNRGRYNLKTFNPDDSSSWTWQIDHIEPDSNFSYDSLEHPDFYKSYALSNLRPLRSDINNKDLNNRTQEQIQQIKWDIEKFLLTKQKRK